MISIENSNLKESKKTDISYTITDDLLTFYEDVYEKLTNEKVISLIENEKLKFYNKHFNNNLKDNEINERNVLLQSIRMTQEKINSLIKDKKEFEYVYDYFIKGQNYNIKTIHKIKFDQEENKNNATIENKKDFEEYEESLKKLKILETIPFSINNSTSLNDILQITSESFLKDKIKLEEEEFKKIKENEIKINKQLKKEEKLLNNIDNNDKLVINKSNIDKQNKSTSIISPSKSPVENLLLTSNPKLKSNGHLDASDLKHIQKIEKEMEEEMEKEIFNYTKGMKNYARSFHTTLIQDNKKLTKIEEIQNVEKNKTDNQLDKLTQFSRKLTIGFWRLLLMILIVIVTFIFTLFTIRLFPKLA